MKIKRNLIIKKNYALVPLTNGKFAIINLEDVKKVNKHNWYYSGGKYSDYAWTVINNKKIYKIRHFLSSHIAFLLPVTEVL